jgi:hypothetical protein
MPKEALFRLLKRWKRYRSRGSVNDIPRNTRGLYVLYRKKGDDATRKLYEVTYIGVAGLGKGGTGGIRGRLQRHASKKKQKRRMKRQNWTHYSMFEVHDNVTREEIRELETLLLAIFKHDRRIQLTNKQRDSRKLTALRRELQWKKDKD